MSQLNVFDVFRRGAVPSVEGTLGAGGTGVRAVENLQAKLRAGETVEPSTLQQVVDTVNQARSAGTFLEQGARQVLINPPVDPTLPAGTNYRYRVRVQVQVPDALSDTGYSVIDTVVPVDSETALSRQQIHDLVRPAVDLIKANRSGQRYKGIDVAVDYPGATVSSQEIISAYRGIYTRPEGATE